MMNVTIEEWVAKLLAKNNIAGIDSLTRDMILGEIEETTGAIGNERIWALGSPTKSAAAMHIGNIETVEEYIVFLEGLLPQEMTG